MSRRNNPDFDRFEGTIKIKNLYGRDADDIRAKARLAANMPDGIVTLSELETTVMQNEDKPYHVRDVTVKRPPIVGLRHEGVTVTVTKEDIEQAVRNRERYSAAEIDAAIQRLRYTQLSAEKITQSIIDDRRINRERQERITPEGVYLNKDWPDTISRKELGNAISRWRAKGYTIAATADNLFAMAVQPVPVPQSGEVWAEDSTGVMFRRTLNGMWQIFGDSVNYPDGYPHRPMTKIR